VGRKPSEVTTAKERQKAEQDLREAALAYGLALEYREGQASAPKVKREDAQESVDGAAGRLLTAASVYFVASRGGPDRRPRSRGRSGRGNLMAQFVQVGKSWLNLDLVRSVQQSPTPGDPAQTASLRVYFSDGADQTFKDPADMKILEDWLKTHKAP
jgi:hypothetical protein